MRYKNLLLDIDGVVIGSENSPTGHNPKLQYCLNNYMNLGGKVGLVTGRGEYYTSALYEFLGLNGVRIIELGAAIITPDNKRIEINSLENRNGIIDFLKAEGILKLVNEEPKNFMITLLLPEFPYHDSKKLIEIYNSINQKFRENFPNANISVIEQSIDIVNPKVDKGKAIEFYAKKERINLEETVMVGDSRNDHSAFEVVGRNNGLVCYVGLEDNYARELKNEFPNYVRTRSKRSSGVVEVINLLLEM